MSELQRVLAEAMKLSTRERAELIAALAESLDADEPESEAEIFASWVSEAKRRLEALHAGTSKGVPFEDIDRRIRAMIERAKLQASVG